MVLIDDDIKTQKNAIFTLLYSLLNHLKLNCLIKVEII